MTSQQSSATCQATEHQQGLPSAGLPVITLSACFAWIHGVCSIPGIPTPTRKGPEPV